MPPLSQVGQLRANPLANISNFVRLAECECVGTPTCSDNGSTTLADTVVVQTFTYQGTVYTFSPTILVNDPEAIEQALFAVIGLYEVDPIINVAYTGGALVVEHIGAGTLSLIVTSGNDQTLTRSCNLETICEYSFCVDGAVEIDGVALANSPYEYDSVTPANNAAIAADLVTDLEAAITDSSVVVTIDEDNEQFCAVISAPQGTDINFNGSTLPGLNCAQVFTA